MENKKFNIMLAILATGIMSFSGVLIETAMNVTFPLLINEFSITTGQVHWVTTIYLLIISISIPVSPFLSKNYSTRNMFQFAMLTFMIGVIIDSISPTFLILLIGRLLQGLATGIALPLMFNIILTRVPLKNRGGMIGVGTLTTAIAPALGPTYGGILTSTIGWRYIYLCLIPILIITYIIGINAIPKEKVTKTGSLNVGALLMLGVFFTALLLSLNFFPNILFFILIVGAVLCFTIFIDLNKKSSLFTLRVFKISGFRRTLLVFFIIQCLLLGISFILPNVMQVVYNVTPLTAGIIMFPGALIGAVFGPISGKILDKFGEKKPIILGLSSASIGLLALTYALNQGNLFLIIGFHILIMIGFGLSYSNLMTVGLSSIDSTIQSDGNAIFSTLQQFSGALSTSLVAMSIKLTQDLSSDISIGTINGATIILISFTVIMIISSVNTFKSLK